MGTLLVHKRNTPIATLALVTGLLLVLLIPMPGISAPSDSMEPGSTRLTDGTTMVFRLYKPRNYSSTKKHPLIVTLHGVGEKGSDNRIQVDREEIVRQWMMDSVQKKYAPFILSPQCPSNSSWAAGDGSAGGPDNGVVKVIDSLKAVYSLDTTRLYVAGLSMGGAGTWGMVKSYPRKFAAVIACCGAMGFSPSFTVAMIDGANTAKTSYWAFHGTADPTVDVMYSRRIDTAVRNAGIPVVHYASSARMTNPTGISTDSLKKTVASGALHLYSESTNGDHKAGWIEAWYSPLVVPWLFSKSKVNGQTFVTWPAPGVAETKVFSEKKVSHHHKGELQISGTMIRWRGIAFLPARLRIFSANGVLLMRHGIARSEGGITCPLAAKGVYCAEIRTAGQAPHRVIALQRD